MVGNATQRQKRAVEIDGQQLSPGFEGDLEWVAGGAVARVCKARIDPPEVCRGGVDGCEDVVFLRNIAANGQNTRAQRLKFFLCALIFIFVARPYGDACARAGHTARKSKADATVSSGHNDRALTEIEHGPLLLMDDQNGRAFASCPSVLGAVAKSDSASRQI